MLVVRFQTDPTAIIVNNQPMTAAMAIEEFLAIVGKPDRVYDGKTPAPVGHRNNQIHVFDRDGFYVYEHHYTRRAYCINLAWDVTERTYDFTPLNPFSGEFWLDDQRINRGPLRLRDFFNARRAPFKPVLRIWNTLQKDGYSCIVSNWWPRTRSGSKSSVEWVSDFSLSWPNDPWQMPADAE